MELKFHVSVRIAKPVAEVFDAVYSPGKLSEYFSTGGASGPLDQGTTVIWTFADYPHDVAVQVVEVIEQEKIVFEWQADGRPYNTRVEMNFESTDDGRTLLSVAESGWKENDADLGSSYRNCMGWAQMVSCLKAWLEYEINLREGYFK